MVTITSLVAKNEPAEGVQVKWENGQLVLIVTKKGLVACGAISCEVMEEFGLAIAIAKGTKEKPLATPEDLLNAKIINVTTKAREYGINIGDTGKEALEKLVS